MNTPRTDRNERIVLGGVGGNWKVVTSDFARQLECELSAMTSLADRLAEALESQAAFPNCARAKVLSNESLAAYENHKKPEQQIDQPCDCIEKCGKYWIQRCNCQNDTSLAEAQSWCDHENHKQKTP